MRKIKIKSTTATTVPGYENPNGQVVVADTGFPSGSFAGQRVYRLRCRHCGHYYGANGCDIHTRLCPNHQHGKPGEPLREAPRSLFDEPAV